MQLNVRLPEELTRKLEALERATNQSTSDVVRAALERYFDEICAPGRSARDAISSSGLVGCGEAEADLSATYKARLQEMVSQESRRLAAWERIQPLLERPSVHLGRRLSRDEFHER